MFLLLVQFFFVYLNLLTKGLTINQDCYPISEFPPWMMGYFHAQFADGSSANARFTRRYANVTFSRGEQGFLTMTQPLKEDEKGSFLFHECVQIIGMKSEHRCSLLIREKDKNGYMEYIHKDPLFISICPQSIYSPGLEIEIVTRINSTQSFLH